MVKYMHMQGQKSHIKPHVVWFKQKLKFFGLFLPLISFANLIFSNNTFALFAPTLSASVDQANLQVNGNQVINSTNKTTEIPFNFTVNTNNRTGYTATFSAETDNTALTNAESAVGAKIDSISTNLTLNNLPNNTWGYKFGGASNYAPIPALSTPAQILQTAGKTNGNESNQLSIGMKLADNLESGNYQNKLILSFISNPYRMRAMMTEGPDFNTKLKSLETATNKIEHFKKSTVAPAISMNAVNIDDEESDYEIKLWLDHTDKTAYYYAEPENVYLNTDSSKMFYVSTSEQKLRNILDMNLSNFDTSQVKSMKWMFACIPNLTTLNLSSFDTSKVTDMSHMFYNMSNLISLNLSNFNTSNVWNMYSMFSDMPNLTTLNLSSFDTSKVTDMSYMFYGMSNLISLNLSNFNTSHVTNMECMFYGMSSLTSLNISNFNTSRVTNMDGMFASMSNLTSLNLSNFDTSWVTDMSGMFSSMSNLTTLNLSSFNTANVTDMSAMFAGLPNLATLDLSSFDTSNVTDMSGMFYEASNLSVLNLSNFNTSRVTNMEAMFYNMVSLTSLDLSSFNTPEVTNMSNMFSLSDAYKPNDKLEKIYVNNDFNTAKLTNFSEMFKNRKKLRGGNGSYLSDPSTTDKTWLRIDDLVNGRPGYFTRKP